MDEWFASFLSSCIRSVFSYESDMVPDLTKDLSKDVYTQMYLALASIARCVSSTVRFNTLTACIE